MKTGLEKLFDKPIKQKIKINPVNKQTKAWQKNEHKEDIPEVNQKQVYEKDVKLWFPLI